MRTVGVAPIEWLMAWYRSQCDRDWEHQHGIRIGTLDNPGWSLDVNLAETAQAGKVLPQKMVERSEDDWVFVEVKDDAFRARGGPGNLAEMIQLFAAFVEDRLVP
jgi:argininosuccinate synthase